LLAGVSDQTRPLRHCRRHRRAVGGGPELARAASGYDAPCTLSHLAGVGGQPPAIGLGRTVWAAHMRARSIQTPTSLPSPSARSGRWAWPGTDRGWYSRCVVNVEGLVPVALAFARACSTGPSPVWRITSITRPRRSRGYRTERGPTAGRHHCGSALGLAGSLPEPAREEIIIYKEI
jgi:hypothetical protein